MIKSSIIIMWLAVITVTICPNAVSGPYSAADDGIPGIIHGMVNPVFKGWATGYLNYAPACGVDENWLKPEQTLGPVTGNGMDIASLGELDSSQITAGDAPGEITLTFDVPIINGDGADFAVFENGFISGGGDDAAGQIFAELAYVEVSSDGNTFIRFPFISLTSEPAGAYGTIDSTDVYNLAGKHCNNYGSSFGTPFDLAELAEKPGIDINNIRFVRIVDIPGSGDFLDSEGRPIYDAWPTWGSGGFDLEAVGVIHQKVIGDGDNNRRVELVDAVITLQLTAGLRSFQNEPFMLGDVNFDNKVDLMDAIIPLQILTGVER